jgi:uncharacterized protein YicC (UPF0701 family)
MTGFGEARIETEDLTVGIEVRALNNRHLKLSVRGSDPYPMFEAELEKVVRRHVRRGTLTVHVRVQRVAETANLTLNISALTTYLQQIRIACEDAGLPEFAGSILPGLLALPGVAPETGFIGSPPEGEWPIVEQTLSNALHRLDTMRREEGRTMATELFSHHRTVTVELDAVRAILPTIAAEYRRRLLERVRIALSDAGVAIQPEQLIREVALFADRTDVSEEITRLSAHLDQFAELVRKGDEAGRKLEFVIQEMGREVNTLGSKAGDVAISRHVVEMKATLEKIRELVQNVE